MTTAASFSAWIHPTGAGSDATHGGTILVKEGEYIIARYANGTIRWGFANSNPGWAFVDTGYVVAPLNQWTHISITYDNGTIKTYANGSLVHTYSGSGAIGDAITGQNDFRIGGRQAISQHFQGRIEEVHVYNRALAATEISALANGPASALPAVNWLVADHLGTPRMIIDQTGTVANVKRHDYLPFGEELLAPAGGRSASLGYTSGDAVRQQFTEKERDLETGLDYFIARYYSSTQGRFTGVDPLMGSGKPDLPQSWNRYSYCINNPLIFVDPDGLVWGYRRNEETGVTTYQWFDGDEVGEGFTEVTNFYVEGVIDGKLVGLTLNPEGPMSFWKYALIASTAAKFIYSAEDFFVKGYEIGPTQAEQRAFSRTGAVDMMPNQAFHAGLFLAGLRGIGGSTGAGLSMQGKAYEIGLLNKHLPGTSQAAKAVAKDPAGAFVFNDLSTLSRVESEIFSRGAYTGTVRGWERFGLRFDQPIGTQIRKDGTTTALDYGEMKMRSNGLYHVTP